MAAFRYGTEDTSVIGWYSPYGTGNYTGETLSQMGLSDGNWHCLEYRVKLNTTGNEDGLFQFWADGVLKLSATGGTPYNTADKIYMLLPGSVGNANGNFLSSINSWGYIAFDNYVASTERIGCLTEGGGEGSTRSFKGGSAGGTMK
jgi:hypothetical protein